MEVIEVTEREIEVIEVIERGPQGPQGAGITTLTTQGDLLYRGATTGERLPIGTTGQILKVSSGGIPEWGAAPSSGVSSVSGTSPIVSSGGSAPAISITAATTSAAGSMSAADKTKLDGIASGAEVNVNADWNASSGDAQILNKPTIPSTAADVGAVPTSRTISAGTGLTGGGDLTANRTLSVSYGSSNPAALGTASAGASNDVSRADHVHSAEVSDSAFRVLGSTDATKKVAIEVDTNVPANTTVTLTAPSASGTIALVGDAPASHSHTPSEVGLGNVSNTAQVTSVTGTAPIVSSGGTTPAISIQNSPTFTGDVTINGASTGASGTLKVGSTTGSFTRDVELSDQGIVLRNSGSSGTTTIARGIGGTLSYTLTPPAASGTIALTGHTHAASDVTSGVFDNARINFAAPSAIGSTTPAAVSATDLSASNRLNIPNTNGTTAGDIYRNANTLRYRDGTNTERLLLNASDNLANLASAATSRTNLGVGSSDAVTFGSIQNTPIGSTTAAAITGTTGTFTTLNATNGTLTASAPVLDLSQTWNNSGVTFTAFRLNATNTNSSALSLLADFQVGGTTQFSVRRDGVVACANRINITSAVNGLEVSQASNGASPVRYTVDSAGTGNAQIRTSGNVIEQIGGTATSGQTFRLYNTYTDASNYERGFMRWSSNVLEIGSEALGTGSSRNVAFFRGGARQFTLIGSGALQLESTGQLSWASRGAILMSADGVMWLSNNAGTDFGRLAFGGTTSSFPALKRSSTTLQVRLADDSAFAPLEALSFTTANSRIVCDDTNTVLHVGNTPRVTLSGVDGTFLALHANHEIRWATGRSDQAAANPSVILVRDGANDTLAMRRTTNGQTFRLYNTVSGTNNVNFDRVNFRWASNEFIIDAEAGGTGTLRGIKIGSATSSLLGFYGVTPVDQPATVADPAGGGTIDAEARTAINAIIDRLQELGLIA